jgi:hypothetical protein
MAGSWPSKSAPTPCTGSPGRRYIPYTVRYTSKTYVNSHPGPREMGPASTFEPEIFVRDNKSCNKSLNVVIRKREFGD